jgi:hypothetical protein
MATKKPKISVYLESEEQKQALEEWAQQEKRTVSNLISYIVDQALESRESKNSKDLDKKKIK